MDGKYVGNRPIKLSKIKDDLYGKIDTVSVSGRKVCLLLLSSFSLLTVPSFPPSSFLFNLHSTLVTSHSSLFTIPIAILHSSLSHW
jgi:hypothetical protein